MSSKTLPRVTYPEGAVNLAKVERMVNDDPSAPETLRALNELFRAIDRGLPLIAFAGSLDHEELRTTRGRIGLIDLIGWVERGQEISLGSLWERYGSLRPYLRSRTEHFVAAKRAERELMADSDEFGERLLDSLERELRQLPSD